MDFLPPLRLLRMVNDRHKNETSSSSDISAAIESYKYLGAGEQVFGKELVL